RKTITGRMPCIAKSTASRGRHAWPDASIRSFCQRCGSATGGEMARAAAATISGTSGIASSQRSARSGSPARRLFLDELDAIAVGVFDKGDHRRAVFHRSGRAHDLAAATGDLLARLVRVLDLDRDVAVA